MKNLRPNGHLTQTQMDYANRNNINHMDYILTILQQMADYNEQRIKNRNHDRVRIRARKPFIVIGHGSDWKIQAEKLRGTDIPIIATDVCANELFDMGIIPQYITTYEEASKNVFKEMFDFENIKKHKVKIIGSRMTRQWLADNLKEYGMGMTRYTDYPVQDTSNVGLFSCMYAKTELLADRIILIGMNCWGKEKYPFLNWYVDWRKFVGESNDKLIVNCSEGGILYFERIIDCDFNDMEVEYGHPS